jgi:hypothetical protein
MSAIAKRPPRLSRRVASWKHACFVGGEIDDAVRDHAVKGFGRQAGTLDVGLPISHVVNCRRVREALGLGKLRVRHVDAPPHGRSVQLSAPR